MRNRVDLDGMVDRLVTMVLFFFTAGTQTAGAEVMGLMIDGGLKTEC